MAVSVNGLFLSANYTQNEARSTREKQIQASVLKVT